MRRTLLFGLLLGGQVLVSARALDKRQLDCSHPESLEIGKSYTDCPKKNEVDDDGKCPISDTEQCGPSYCEERVTVKYGKEVPFENSRCQAKSACSLAKAKSVSTTTSLSINVDGGGGPSSDTLTSAFNAGVSYSFSESVSYSTTVTFPRPDKAKDKCGYFTFIPYYIESCGTLTNAEGAAVFTLTGQQCDEKDTIHNWCNTTPAKNDDDKTNGVVVFVLTNCKTNKPLPMNQQDPAYSAEGVANPPAK